MSTWVPVIDRHFNPSIIAACLMYWKTLDRIPWFPGVKWAVFAVAVALHLAGCVSVAVVKLQELHSSLTILPTPPPLLPSLGEHLKEFISMSKLLFCILRTALCSSPANLYAHHTISWLCIVFQPFCIFCLGWCWRIFASRSPPGLETSGLFTPFGENCVIQPHI